MPNNNPTTQRTALYAGSFNPFTIGHLSILRRGLELFDRVVVMIGINGSKNEKAEDPAMLQSRLSKLPGLEGVEVIAWDGLTVDAAAQVGARWLLRGVRSVADYEYERNLADINRRISGLETVVLFAQPDTAMISSSMVRELRHFGRNVDDLIV
ncbi:MAG: pantetheine-phosphate adenylyltransferase [Bacteroides sp.]|nr:pantetheine-phosphate adenylyltransferase [Bacteroides sp.]MCM1414162.1 pantetheine-phosphate adenylyltransferase [Bacteroides sp.]MCM1471288.1 pantetheine-phosphate adenylyltransferase [Bacteroides sp.]